MPKFEKQNFDLRNKHISNIIEVNALSASSIIDSKISDNQFRKITTQELRKKVRSIIPNLISLDGTKLEEPVLIASTSGNNNPTIDRIEKRLPESILSVDRNSDLFKFILRYFSTFDIDRYKIYTFYSKESNLSISIHGDWLPLYEGENTNNYKSKTRTVKKRGAGEITELLMQFPHTKHIEQSIRVEIVQQSSAEIICNMFGVFAELGMVESPDGCWARKFSRNMTIVPWGDSQIVLQEHIQLMPDDADLFRKFKPIIDDYRYVTYLRPDLFGVSCEIIQWAKELSETPGIMFDDSIDLVTEIVRVHPQWKFSSQEARMVKLVKDETGMSVMESIECLNGILKVNSDVSNVSIDLIQLVKQFKDTTGMSISFSIDFLAEHDLLGAALITFDTLRDDK